LTKIEYVIAIKMMHLLFLIVTFDLGRRGSRCIDWVGNSEASSEGFEMERRDYYTATWVTPYPDWGWYHSASLVKMEWRTR